MTLVVWSSQKVVSMSPSSTKLLLLCWLCLPLWACQAETAPPTPVVWLADGEHILIQHRWLYTLSSKTVQPIKLPKATQSQEGDRDRTVPSPITQLATRQRALTQAIFLCLVSKK